MEQDEPKSVASRPGAQGAAESRRVAAGRWRWTVQERADAWASFDAFAQNAGAYVAMFTVSVLAPLLTHSLGWRPPFLLFAAAPSLVFVGYRALGSATERRLQLPFRAQMTHALIVSSLVAGVSFLGVLWLTERLPTAKLAALASFGVLGPVLARWHWSRRLALPEPTVEPPTSSA